MDLQTLIVAITVGVAAAFVIRTFTRQFTSRDRKGCASCAHGQSGHGGAGLVRQTGLAGQTGLARQSGAHENGDLIQVETIQVEESVRE